MPAQRALGAVIAVLVAVGAAGCAAAEQPAPEVEPVGLATGQAAASADGTAEPRATAVEPAAEPAAAASPEPSPPLEPSDPADSRSGRRAAAAAVDRPFAVGATITVTEAGDPWAEVSVSEVREIAHDAAGEVDDLPQTPGNVFIESLITYEALADGVEYNPFDWQAFADGEAIDEHALVLNGRQPDLRSGSLPEGGVAQGWLVYEVPAAGEVVLAYGSNVFLDAPPVFEVVLRDG